MAELLAPMYRKRQPFFGLQFDTTIGPLPQPNPRHDTWIDFFREQRLLFMAQLAHERAGLSADLLRRFIAQLLLNLIQIWLFTPTQRQQTVPAVPKG